MSEKEICICAAVRLEDGRIIRGHRHDDCIQTALKWKNAGQNIGALYQDQQGFLTSRGRFVSRKQAAELERQAGREVNGDLLFSEDLY